MNSNTTINKISVRLWGHYEGKEIFVFRLTNKRGTYIELMNYGATLLSIVVPDRTGKTGNVVLGFDNFESYLTDDCYLGATIGRFANRIARAQFLMDGTPVKLDANEGPHSNHGGFNGFHRQVFEHLQTENGLCFAWRSRDGEGGYPGELSMQVYYQWSDNDELLIHYTANSDKDTVANFTNHAYFNLTEGQQQVLDHSLTIYADAVLEDGPDYIPTGVLIPAADKAFDGQRVYERLSHSGQKLEGINLCYVLYDEDGSSLRLAAVLTDKFSGRRLEVFTTYPGLLLYTGDFLRSCAPGHHGVPYGPFDGLCLECQYFPDSPNHPAFPSTILKAGETYHEQIVYKFGIEPVINPNK